jgi:hypothetical protein
VSVLGGFAAVPAATPLDAFWDTCRDDFVVGAVINVRGFLFKLESCDTRTEVVCRLAPPLMNEPDLPACVQLLKELGRA